VDNISPHSAATGHGFLDVTFTVHWTAKFH
jgi:hypothetical protein